MLQWARERGCPWDSRTCSSAANGGHLAVLQWARQHGCPWDKETCTSAAKGGHLAVLQWAQWHGCPWDKEKCRAEASAEFFGFRIFESDIWERGGQPPVTVRAATPVPAMAAVPPMRGGGSRVRMLCGERAARW